VLQEITRLAHVAVTRAKDKLFITGHRFCEGSSDASHIGKFMQQTSCSVFLTPLPSSIALPLDQPSIMTKEVHHGGDIENELQRRARPIWSAGTQQCNTLSRWAPGSHSPLLSASPCFPLDGGNGVALAACRACIWDESDGVLNQLQSFYCSLLFLVENGETHC
jgi:hypothetical protein